MESAVPLADKSYFEEVAQYVSPGFTASTSPKHLNISDTQPLAKLPLEEMIIFCQLFKMQQQQDDENLHK